MTARPLQVLAALAALLAPLGHAAAAGEGRFTPSRPGLANFGNDPALRCPPSAIADALGDLLELRLKENRKLPRAAPDARLCLAAQVFLAWESRESPGRELVRQVSEHVGLPAPMRTPSFALIESEEPRLVAENLAEAVATFSESSSQPWYGFATQRVRRGPRDIRTRVVLVLLDSGLSLDPLPRRLDLGASAKVSGKLLGDFESPRLYVSDAEGKLHSPSPGPGQAFAAELACGQRPGVIRVEIRGELGGSPNVLARFPVACGTALETSFAVGAPAPWTGDEAEQVRRMVEVMNGERTGAGLKALLVDAALAGVARGVAEHVKAEAARGGFGVPGDLVARLEKVGITSQLVLQNPAQGRSAQEVMEQMTTSPAHRASYMNPEITKVGVGLVSGKDAENAPTVFVDQIFVKELPPIDVEPVRGQLRQAVAQKRKDGRFSPVESDPGLEEFAQAYVKELAAAAGNLSKARHDELVKGMDKAFKGVTMVRGARVEPLDLAEEPEVTVKAKAFGVGVAQGMHPKLGRAAVYAVIVLGTHK